MPFYVVLSIFVFVVGFRSVNCDILPSFKQEVIINGRDAVAGQFPYECALFLNNQFFCTSSIISNQSILTAAHCVVIDGSQQDASQYFAICNVSKSSSEYRVDFNKVTVHPDYNGDTLNNDLAIFEASHPIPFNKNVKPVCLARPDTGMDEYKKATAMGWGKTTRDIFAQDDIPDILQYVEQDIPTNVICNTFYFGYIDENKICAGGIDNGICSGDSGGSLVHPGNGYDVQIGISSFGMRASTCGTPVPAVFTRVSKYTKYIMSVAKGDICTA